MKTKFQCRLMREARYAGTKKLFASFSLLAALAPALAAPQTVTLSIPGMSCAACPVTVKRALSKVEGVIKAEVNFGKREVVVSFDDAKTNIRALTKATENAGYPASIKE